jgi:hypothetical protein
MRVSFHLSPAGPVAFDFDKIEVPTYLGVGLRTLCSARSARTRSYE